MASKNSPERRGTDPMPGSVGGVTSRDVPLSRLIRAQPWTKRKSDSLSGYSGVYTERPDKQLAAAPARGRSSSAYKPDVLLLGTIGRASRSFYSDAVR
jgi:hypothetical protein